MKKIFSLACLLLVTSLFSQRVKDSIASKKLNETRSFVVSLPSDYDTNLDKKYPILLLLDGEYLLNPFEGSVKYGNYWDDLPQMIIVAVNQNYNDKRIDDSQFDSNGLPTGKGANFFEFIGMELIPHLEKVYRTQPFRIIAGHDTTAGFINFYLYKDPSIFNAYISLAPEMPPKTIIRVPEQLAKSQKPIFYYQAVGTSDIAEIKGNMKAMDAKIKAGQNKVYKYQFDEFKRATHYSVVAQAIPQALYFIFEGYQAISMQEFKENIAVLESGYAKYLIDRYTNLEKNVGLKVTPRLTDFRAIEAAILKNKAYPEFQELSDYAELQYPKTTLSIYHQGMYYEKMGENKRAVKEYRKAFYAVEIGEITKAFLLNKAESLATVKDDSKVGDLPNVEEDKKEGGE